MLGRNFKKYNLNVSIAKIRNIAGTDRQGTSAYGLVKVIELYGFDQKVVETDKSVLTPKLILPAIAHVVINGTLLHYAVITKILTYAWILLSTLVWTRYE